MKVLLCVFSGTGNTLIATHNLEKEFIDNGYDVDIYIVNRPYKDIPDCNNYDLIGLGYPIHAFNAPQIFVRFCKKLPKVSSKNIFFYKTSGEPFRVNHASSFTCYKILKRKGYHQIMDVQMLMSYNVIFKYPDGLAKQMYIYTQKMCKVIVKRIMNNEVDKPKYNLLTILWSYFSRIEWIGTWIDGPLYHVKKKKCNKCGLCIRSCPSHNIKTNSKGYPKFSYHCTFCMCCSFNCPKDAIRLGLINPLKVNGSYEFDKLMQNKNIPDIFVTNDTKGYFRLFKKYYDYWDKLFDKYSI